MGNGSKGTSPGKELANEAVDVLVGPALPGTPRMCEVYLDARIDALGSQLTRYYSGHADNKLSWRYSLYKVRTFFETNPDEES